jgi:hypothetical protein
MTAFHSHRTTEPALAFLELSYTFNLFLVLSIAAPVHASESTLTIWVCASTTHTDGAQAARDWLKSRNSDSPALQGAQAAMVI